MSFYKKITTGIIVLFLSHYGYGQFGRMQKVSTGYARQKWKLEDPFEQKVFIENKEGQFDGITGNKDEKILYNTRIGGVEVYFTSSGLTYRYDKYPEITQKETEDEKEKSTAPQTYIFREQWVGSNRYPEVIPEDKVPFYYTYPTNSGHTIIAHAFKKLLYKNVYPGIDVEYSFKDKKKGIEYSIVVHPGADLSKVKLAYPDSKNIKKNSKGEVDIESGMGLFTDGAPDKAFCAETNEEVSAKYLLNDNEESFDAGNYNRKYTLIIDPFKRNPLYSGYDAGYDVCYDLKGNVYAYGSYSWFQEVKINSLGAIQWTYTAVFPQPAGGQQYGDFAVDEVSGTSYVTSSGDAIIQKVNTLGIKIGSKDVSGQMNEIWRMAYNHCEGKLIIAGGGTAGNYQLASLDTSLITFSPVNVLNTVGGHHDVDLLAIDNTNNYCYMATALADNNDFSFANTMQKVPINGFLPIIWSVPDGFSFTEACCDINYIDGAVGHTLAMNGLVASPNWLYGYDGKTLYRYNKNTGATVTTKVISGISYNWGGIDVDVCNNVYLGFDTVVSIYDSALNVTGTIHPGYQVYDLHIMPNNGLCISGKGFVSEFSIVGNAMTISKTENNPPCGKTKGSATARLVGCGSDSSQYNYLWSNGATTQQDTGLVPGTYTVTISSGCNFTFTDTVNIKSSSNGGMTLSMSGTNITCFGDSNGTATVAVTAGGTPPYTYSWAPINSSNATVSNLKAGTYTVTVSDIAGCNTASITITQPQKLMDSVISNGPVGCNGGNNGTATVTSKGGTGSYTYNWAPVGGTGTTATGLSVGTYTVTVHDSNGCGAAVTVLITQPAVLTANIAASNNVSCNGGNNGSATVSAGGGTVPYTYNWTPVGGSNATANNLSAGTYTITVKDKNGCSATASVTITQPTVLTANITASTNEVCHGGNTGSATVTAGGGTIPYTYNWAPAGGSNATANNISAGTYTVTVKDKNGCSATASVTITEPPLLTASITSITDEKCNGQAIGGATVTAGGGTGAYTYNWIPSGGNGTSATNLTAGTYTITVTDQNGCTATAAAVITQPAPLTANINTMNNISCNGGNNGSATVTAGGGTAPYTYNWTPVGGNNPTASNLTIGTYTITVNDKNGCGATASVTITQPPVLTANINSATNVKCNGSATGGATVTAGGGTTPYTYNWTPSGGNNVTATNLTAGTYTITVTDKDGCTATASINITQPPLLTSSISTSTDVNCNGGNDGSATVAAGGGTIQYTYNWAPSGGSNASATNLTAGTYTVTVTDKNGCTSTSTVTITQPNPIIETVVANGTKCSNVDGGATATASGGTGAFTYSWSPGGATTASVTGLSQGTYTCTITDARGCKVAQTTTIINTGPIITPSLTVNYGDTAFLAVTGGGTSFLWSPAEGLSCTTCPNPFATPTVTTNYCVQVDDTIYGCNYNLCALITVETPCADFTVPNVFTPNNDGRNDDFVVNILNPTSYSIVIYDRWGKEMYTSKDPTVYWNGRILNTQRMVPDGIYYYVIKANCGGNDYTKKGFVQVIGEE